jgi:hypothetical protein
MLVPSNLYVMVAVMLNETTFCEVCWSSAKSTSFKLERDLFCCFDLISLLTDGLWGLDNSFTCSSCFAFFNESTDEEGFKVFLDGI